VGQHFNAVKRARKRVRILAGLLAAVALVVGAVTLVDPLGTLSKASLSVDVHDAGPAQDVDPTLAQKLADTYAPAMVFSVGSSPELFRPMSVDEFERHSTLRDGNWNLAQTITRADPANGWRSERAYYCEELGGRRAPADAAPVPECGHGVGLTAPVTTYARVVQSPLDGFGWYAIEYWSLYFNDFWSHSKTNSPGAAYQSHEGDWEGAIVLLTSDQEPRAVAYTQHGGVEVRPWPAAGEDFGVTLAGSTHPVEYVARGSHAGYFTPGIRLIDPQLMDGRLRHGLLKRAVADATLQDVIEAGTERNNTDGCALSASGLVPAAIPDGGSVPSVRCTDREIIDPIDDTTGWVTAGGTWGTKHDINVKRLPARFRKYLNAQDSAPTFPRLDGKGDISQKWRDPWVYSIDWCFYTKYRPSKVKTDRAGYPLCRQGDLQIPSGLYYDPQAPWYVTLLQAVAVVFIIAGGFYLLAVLISAVEPLIPGWGGPGAPGAADG
jgi:hypothetical protein